MWKTKKLISAGGNGWALRENIGIIIVIITISAAVNILLLTGPIFMILIYDRVLSSGSKETLLVIFLLVVLLYAVYAVLEYSRTALVSRLGLSLVNRIRQAAFSVSIQERHTDEKRVKGRIPLNDIDTTQSFFLSGAFMAILDLPWSALFIVVLFVFHPWMGWFGVAGISILILLTFLSQILSKGKALERIDASSLARRISSSALESADYISGSGGVNDAFSRWALIKDRESEALLRHGDITGSFASVGKSLRLLLQSAMLAFGAWLSLIGEITSGMIIAGTIILGRCLQPVDQVLSNLKTIQMGLEGFRGASESISKLNERSQKMQLPEPPPRMTLSNVACGAPHSNSHVLYDVDLKLEPGETLAIIGASGSGKSTFLKTIGGVWPAVAGEIRLGDAPLEQYSSEAIADHMGYMPQDIRLFPATIAENIAQLQLNYDADAVVTAAKLASVHDAILALPNGYNTFCGGYESQLSAGQRQLIALARAIYKNPKVLVLDEPTSSLDRSSRAMFLKFVRNWCAEGRSIVFSSHQEEVIRAATKIAVVNDGKITILDSSKRISNHSGGGSNRPVNMKFSEIK